jgi:transglutaminase-like putative cysteine protease
MKLRHTFVSSLTPTTFLLVCLTLFAAPAQAQFQGWKPIDPAHVALKAPVVDKDADAEAIFWEVYFKDEWDGSVPRKVLSHYIRIKVFTQRGVENHGKVDLVYSDRGAIRDIAARTIKPDGSVVEMKKDAVFDREIVRLSGLKVKAKSFALPAVEPGVIVEYRWIEQRPLTSLYTRLHFQREIPVQSVKYYIKPLSDTTMGMRSMSFNCPNVPFVRERDGYFSVSFNNLPAFREEPRMPPEDQVRSWMLLYYSDKDKITPEKYWKEHGKAVYEENKGAMKVNDEVRRAAAEAVGDASAPEQKLERLVAFCRTKIKNVYDDTTVMSEQERKKLKENRSPADTLKRGYGNGRDIDMLFAALAAAAGFETRLINLPDRGDMFFNPNLPDDYFLSVYDVAVKVGADWKFIDPSSVYVPFGMLRWQQEGQQALLADPKDPVFVNTPLSPAESSMEKRTAKLRLSEDGTLEGEARIEYTGHLAVEKKEDYDEESPAEREKRMHDALAKRISNAEIAEVKFENVTDPFKPLVISYKVRVQGYAERTGKRLFLQPGFFEKGVGPLFPTSERKHDVYFYYPWTEEDDIVIELPAGYALDNAESPGDLAFGELGHLKIKIGVTKDQRTLSYKRQFRFTGMLFPKDTYPNLKRAFDAAHQVDNHTITLKQGTAAAEKQ